MPRLIHAWRHRPTHRRVWALAAPMMLCNLSVPMVALVDSAVVGHLPHAQDLAAVVIGSRLIQIIEEASLSDGPQAAIGAAAQWLAQVRQAIEPIRKQG